MTSPSPRLVRLIPGPLSDRTDDELMTLAQAGMRDAFSVLVERHGRRIVQLCSRFVDSAEIGEEIAQETWLAVWSQRANYRAEGKFVVWLITMARNRCRNHLRHDGVVKRIRRSPLEIPTHAIEATSPDEIDRALLAERRRRVRDALGRMLRRRAPCRLPSLASRAMTPNEWTCSWVRSRAPSTGSVCSPV